ncbi:MAG: XRE family transcriptional regulator [Deltaproteobacteria bacterium]|nr:MAG: XRE family transcriptional regulator [Deltaproteobacteria bacterium]RLB86792.1 MAG: XRE family transcriptional regulator [Deltaproteobacteria bacterium]
MTEKHEHKERDPYQDFLSDISSQFERKKEEDAFLESFGVQGEEGADEIRVGERVRQVRENKGLTLEDVSQRTDIDPSYLKKVEEGEVAPPLGVIIKLAKALEMKMGYFISGEENRPYTIVRRQDRKLVSRFDSKKGKYYGYEYESLAPHKKDRHMEPFLVTLVPSATEEERSSHDGQEFIYVLEGKMEVRLKDEVHILEAGDAIYYDSTVPHLVKCHGSETTRILAVLYAEK